MPLNVILRERQRLKDLPERMESMMNRNTWSKRVEVGRNRSPGQHDLTQYGLDCGGGQIVAIAKFLRIDGAKAAIVILRKPQRLWGSTSGVTQRT